VANHLIAAAAPRRSVRQRKFLLSPPLWRNQIQSRSVLNIQIQSRGVVNTQVQSRGSVNTQVQSRSVFDRSCAANYLTPTRPHRFVP
jgi:hypothetical protein